MLAYILMDIEGTTTAIDFVHRTLFPYARTHMAEFLAASAADPAVAAALAETAATMRAEGAGATDPEAVLATLLAWIDSDRKHPALKRLQGMIWERGYREGHYQAHLYADVRPAWDAWRARGLSLGIYSSGSVQAQKLLFAHTPEGDLTPYLAHYFDTAVGHKREASSYRHIATALELAPERVLFLSDIPEELDAARAVGMATTQLLRPGTAASDRHPTVASFDQITLS